MGVSEQFNPTVFFLGASGLIGGPFLNVFRRKYPDIPITALLRSKELDKPLEALGHTTIVHGDFSNLDTITHLSSTHSIVINSASSRDASVTEAILAGIRLRSSEHSFNSRSILIHVSGAGNFANGTSGNSDARSPYFDDKNPEDVRRIDSTYLPNGPCDEPILKAAAAGEVNALIVCPTGVYGTSANRLDKAVGSASYRTPGVWVDWMLRNVAEKGFSPYVGEGTSVFWVIHVDDIVKLMLLVFEKALSVRDTYQPEDVYKSYFIGAAEKLQNKVIAEAFAKLSYRLGNLKEPLTKSVSHEEAGLKYLAANMLILPENAKTLGFQPSQSTLLEVLEQMN